MSSFLQNRLGDICEVINGKAYRQDELLEEGKYKVLRVGNFFSNNSWYYSNLELAEDKYCEFGDLLFAWSASFGPRIWMGDKTIYHYHIWKMIENKKVINRTFLYYYLSNKTKSLMNSTHGSIMLHLTKTFMEDLIITYPKELNSQSQIAKVLYDLDAKIELNNKINAELEAMAKLIYDYWFVQFEFPNEDGKPYKSSGGKMVWNEELRREIPEGWENGTLNNIGEIIGGSTPSKAINANFCQGIGLPWITPKDLSLNKGKKFITRGEWDVTDRGLKEGSLKIMPAGTILLSSRAPIGYLAIARGDVTTNQGFKSFVPKNNFSSEFIFYTVQNLIPEIEANSSGSTFQEVSTGTLRTIKTVLPTSEVLSSYDKKVKPIFKKQDILETQNQKLAELRDWLLPMLMNGQVRVDKLSDHEEHLNMAAEEREKYR
jgi:type I restriction enzyme S subunit